MTVTNANPRQQPAAVVLTEQEIALMRPFGDERVTSPGDLLFETGDGEFPLVVVLSGRVEIVDRSDDLEMLIGSRGPGEFVGELGLLNGQTMFTVGIAREAGSVLVIPRAGVQRIIATLPGISDLLVTTFAARRQTLMQTAAATLSLIGPEHSRDIERIQEFTDRNRIPYRCLTPEDPLAASLLQRFGEAGSDGVSVVVRGQTLLKNPTNLEIARAIGLDLAVNQQTPADLLVIGAGPAGLSAAVYGASEGLSTIVIDDFGIGGQAGSSSRIENYLGFPTGISGGDLAFRAEVQALKFGARVTAPRRVTGLQRWDDLVVLHLDDGSELRGRSVVIATGAHYRNLDVAGDSPFAAADVFYAATELEARLCGDGEIVVVGAGNSAGQAAMFLSGTASTVHLICRGPDLARSMSQYLISRLEQTPNVRIHTMSAIQALQGQEHLESVSIANVRGERVQLPACAVFAMIGADPCTQWLRGMIALDTKGFVLTGADVLASGFEAVASPFQTSQPGIFAVGDVRNGSVKRVASAVGEGSMVVQAVHRFLAETHHTKSPNVDRSPHGLVALASSAEIRHGDRVRDTQ